MSLAPTAVLYLRMPFISGGKGGVPECSELSSRLGNMALLPLDCLQCIAVLPDTPNCAIVLLVVLRDASREDPPVVGFDAGPPVAMNGSPVTARDSALSSDVVRLWPAPASPCVEHSLVNRMWHSSVSPAK
ncbi:hypothetical protein LPJ66_009135 [Kickxella alabastrina]|uniref:Uncharacterized protein n=1 Tax=Kickxella alabastrina TaxID=61397 RepID=A0ACC1IAD3_9FUNG|nr:hypothetical protein LPJ66_009135 [Kickxella alabastrina]